MSWFISLLVKLKDFHWSLQWSENWWIGTKFLSGSCLYVHSNKRSITEFHYHVWVFIMLMLKWIQSNIFIPHYDISINEEGASVHLASGMTSDQFLMVVHSVSLPWMALSMSFWLLKVLNVNDILFSEVGVASFNLERPAPPPSAE